MTPAKAGFRPQLEDLEGRVVPDASSALDADFFSKIQQSQNQAQQQMNDRVRVHTNIYQSETKAAADQNTALEAQKAQTQQQVTDFFKALSVEDAKIRQALQKQLEDAQKRNKDEVNSATNTTKSQIDALTKNPPAGQSPQATQAEINLLLSQYQKFAADKVAESQKLLQSVLNQYSDIQKGELGRYADALANAQAKFKELQAAQQRLASIYVAATSAEVNTLYTEITTLQKQLQKQLTDLQNAYSYLKRQLQLQNQYNQQFQQFNQPSSGSSSGGHLFYDENAPKGH